MHGRALLLTLGLLLALPTAAGAATRVSASESCREGYKGADCSAVVRLTGDDGPSDVTLTREGETVVVRDGFGAVAEAGCQPLPDPGATAVRCPLSSPYLVMSVRARAGGGDDRLQLGEYASVDAGPGDDQVQAQQIEGGPGDDVLRGTSQRDFFDGGPGADRIDGGEGPDTVDYRDRTRPLTVALGTQAPAGEAGEGDKLTSIEEVFGGAGDDELTGSEADEVLDGGPGDDTLRGGPGDDRLLDAVGRNLLDGEAGEDRLSTGREAGQPLVLPAGTSGPKFLSHRARREAGRQDFPIGSPDSRSLLLGGQGDDSLESGLGSDRLDPGPGADWVSARGGRDRVWLRDGAFDEVFCGRFAATRVDSRDLTSGCRRIARTGTPRPRLLSVGGIIFEEFDGSEGIAQIGCPDDQRAGCRGLLRLFALGREVGRIRVAVGPGRREELRFPLDRRLYEVVRSCRRVRGVYRLDTRDARGRPLVFRREQVFYSAGVSSPCG